MNENPNICCLFNLAPHYRGPIYRLMDSEFDIHFYFGNKTRVPIKQMDFEKELSGFQRTYKYSQVFKKLYILRGSSLLIFRNYSKYLLTGQIHCLSVWLFLIFGRILRKDVYLWCHGFYGRESRYEIFIKRIFFKLATGIFVYGKRSRTLMIKNGIDADKVHMVYNSLDYSLHKSMRKKDIDENVYSDIFNNNNPTIIFTGRIEREKKLEILIEAISELREEKVNINLFLIGNLNINYRIDEIVRQFDLNNAVKFYGACYDESILSRFISKASVCISPANIGLTAIHALSYGTPVITHNDFNTQGPEFEAIIPGKTGDFYKSGDLDDLKNKIKIWINKTDRQRLKSKSIAFETIDTKYNPFIQLDIFKMVFQHYDMNTKSK